MRKCSFLILSFIMLGQISLGQTRAEFLDQSKRDARKNNHITKEMQGEVVKHLFKSETGVFYGFIFRSDEQQYFHVRIRSNEGKSIIPYLIKNERLSLTVSGDPLLLREILFRTEEFKKLEKNLDIELTGMAHFQKIVSSAGVYIHDKDLNTFASPLNPNEFLENIAIVKRKRTKGNRVYYALENGDTIVVPSGYDQDYKERASLSYFRTSSIFTKGVYYKSPNTYNYTSSPFMHSLGAIDFHTFLTANPAVILDKAEFTPLNSISDSRGLLKGFEVDRRGQKESLFFNVKNGAKVMDKVKGKDTFSGYYKNIGEDSIVLYVTGEGQSAVLLDNRDQSFVPKSNYEHEEVTVEGKVTKAWFADAKVMNVKNAPAGIGDEINIAKLKYMIVNDSIYIPVKQIVALNIQDKVEEGMDITIKGWVRKQVPGEVSLRGYTIMAVNAFTIDGKTFAQINHNINESF